MPLESSRALASELNYRVSLFTSFRFWALLSILPLAATDPARTPQDAAREASASKRPAFARAARCGGGTKSRTRQRRVRRLDPVSAAARSPANVSTADLCYPPNSSSSTLASFRSAVSKPSVNSHRFRRASRALHRGGPFIRAIARGWSSRAAPRNSELSYLLIRQPRRFR
jgi:hypothetical protein